MLERVESRDKSCRATLVVLLRVLLDVVAVVEVHDAQLLLSVRLNHIVIVLGGVKDWRFLAIFLSERYQILVITKYETSITNFHLKFSDT